MTIETQLTLATGGKSARVFVGNCRELMRQMADASIDAIVTDPPYELGFMGKHWDASGIAYDVNVWREALRVLKPGGHMLAFGGTRTYHRMACAIEDAGFEVRVARRLAGLSAALKPAHEPIVVARKPLNGTVAANVLKHGTVANNVDGTRVEDANPEDFAKLAAGVQAIKARGGSMENSWKNSSDLSGANNASTIGRWPPNVLLSHAPDCGDGNMHPTAKPVEMMRWLVKLVTPPNGVVLDPFAGSGTTGVACVREGFDFIGCELSDEYADFARARIEHG